jgi:hypothetical protein
MQSLFNTIDSVPLYIFILWVLGTGGIVLIFVSWGMLLLGDDDE